MIKTRQSLLASLCIGAFVLAILGGCGGGNPNVSAAEDALESQNYEKALSSIETAIEQDSANVQAYKLKAQILRQMADSTMPPSEYKSYFDRAREAEDKAIQFDPGARSDIRGRRDLAYFQQFQRGGQAFNRARKNSDTTAFRRAASFFAAAGATRPDSASAHLNEAYARLNTNQRAEVIPVLERYVEKADTVDKNAYTLLAQLYITNDRVNDAIPLLEDGTETYPENDELQSLLLNAYNQAGKVDKAMAEYREQIEKNPNNATYRYNYGSLLLQADRYEEAIEQLEKAVEVEPDNVQAQYNLGAAHVNKAVAIDDSIAAIEDQIREEDRKATEEETARLEKLVERRKGNFQEAIPPLERARQMSSAGDGSFKKDACRALFTAYVQTERTDKAAEVEECAGYKEGRAEEALGGGGNGGGNGGGGN